MKISFSSAHKGYVQSELLHDNSGYWCSDSILPHSITIVFYKNTYVYSIDLNLKYKVDDSYTPERVKIIYCKGNECFEDEYVFEYPEGYQRMIVDTFTNKIKIFLLANHTDGKDSHVHNMNIMISPKEKIQISKEL